MNTHMTQSIAEPKHSSMSLIDRVIRTLRELAYNQKINVVTPDVMPTFVWQINNSPHKTLSKYAGQQVSPNDVEMNSELQKFIVKKIQQANYNIMNQKGFDLKPSSIVKVYNERNVMTNRRSEIEIIIKSFNEKVLCSSLKTKTKTNLSKVDIKLTFEAVDINTSIKVVFIKHVNKSSIVYFVYA